MRTYAMMPILVLCSIGAQVSNQVIDKPKDVSLSVAKIEPQSVSDKSADSKLPDFARYDYLAKLIKQTQDSIPTKPDLANVQNFAALTTRGLMYSLQSPYAEHLLQFALLNLQANALQLKQLAALIKDNFSSFKKTIKNREKFFELLGRISDACKTTSDKIAALKLESQEKVEALGVIASFARGEIKLYGQILDMLTPQLSIQPIKQLSESIKIIFSELDKQLDKYIKKQPKQQIETLPSVGA